MGISLNETPQTHATPGQGSVHGDGTVGQRLVERLSIKQGMLDDNEKLRAEIDQLREAIRRLATQDATLSVQDGNVTVTMDATLTDEEREAIETAIVYLKMDEDYPGISKDRAALRNLLERLHT